MRCQVYLEENDLNPSCKMMNHQLEPKNDAWNYDVATVRPLKPEKLGYHQGEDHFSSLNQNGHTSAPEMLCDFMTMHQEIENRTCWPVYTSLGPLDSMKSYTVFNVI